MGRGKPLHPIKRATSIQDVAQAAGVSTATVSRVINTPTMVSEKTAQRVKEAIDSLGYTPNLFAKGLMTRKSQVVALALPDIHGEFYSELLRGADQQAHLMGYHLLVSSQSRTTDMPLSDAMLGIVDGLAMMITESDAHSANRLMEKAAAANLPIVIVDADEHDRGLDSVLIDNATGALEATKHLLSSVPAARIFFVGGPKTNLDTRLRADAFRAALQAAGHSTAEHQLEFREYSETWGYAWANAQHQRGQLRASAVLCANDEIALGVLQAAADLGLEIPSQLRVVGFDDTRLASIVRPKLSSVRVPMEQVGSEAIRLLVERLRNPTNPAQVMRMQTTLVARQSSK